MITLLALVVGLSVVFVFGALMARLGFAAERWIYGRRSK